jgi:hypothetical protein
VRYIKQLPFEKHDVSDRLIYFGDDWAGAFHQVFGADPAPQDKQAFGKP